MNGDSTPGGAWFTNVTGLTNYFNIATETPAAFSYFGPFVTSQEVRAALGIGARPFLDGNLAVELALKGDVMYSQKPNLEALLQGGYKVLLYNGALDLICGATLTERYVPLLAWGGAAGWNASAKAIWHDVNQAGAVSGYSRSYQTLNHVIMRGAGHMAVRRAGAVAAPWLRRARARARAALCACHPLPPLSLPPPRTPAHATLRAPPLLAPRSHSTSLRAP